MRAVGYVRISLPPRDKNGKPKPVANSLSLEHQKRAIAAECESRGWTLSDLAQDAASARQGKRRPGLERALERLDSGEYGALVVSRLDRLARSTLDFAMMLDRARKKNWVIVMIEPRVDLTDPYGKLIAQTAAAFAEFERALISQRTIEGLVIARANGSRLGSPKVIDDKTLKHIMVLRGRDLSYGKIAEQLDLEGVKPVYSERWSRRTIQKVCERLR